jgi:hypothetical protein
MAWKLAENHRPIAEPQVDDWSLECGPSKTLVPVDLKDVYVQMPYQIEAFGSGTADGDRLARAFVHAPDGLAEKLLKDVEGNAAATGYGSTAETPLRLVHDIPRDNRLVVSIAQDDGPQDEIHERPPCDGIGQKSRSPASLNAVHMVPGHAEMKVQKHEDDSDVVLARAVKQRVDIWTD